MHPFHFQRVQQLLPRDFGPRVQFPKMFSLPKQAVEGNFSESVLLTDEAHFTRDGCSAWVVAGRSFRYPLYTVVSTRWGICTLSRYRASVVGIGGNGPVAWPARSPDDMTPLDLFLWGAMKALMYEAPVDCELDLVAQIVAAAGDIAEIPNILESVRHSLYKRHRKCVAAHGDHFQQFCRWCG